MCCDAMVGGSDTGSATLAFAVLFMSIDLSIQQKMFDEIAENVGLNRLPNSADKSRYVDIVAKHSIYYTSINFDSIIRNRA